MAAGNQNDPAMYIATALNRQSVPFVPYAYLPARKMHGWRVAGKRSIDVLVSVTFLTVFALWLFPLLALAIRLQSGGPALFRQRRIGHNGQPFDCWKFRTMYVHQEADGMLCQATLNDARITPIGTWLRRFSIDEFPQFYNVLRGDMSLVGPRPHAPGTCAAGRPFEQVAPGYVRRHCVKPGITGLAQVRGWRGETDTEEKLIRRIESDFEYIATWSLRLDLLILLRTIPAFFAADAY